ncbi:MAG: flagellar M-ring protein FliF [Gammaproteobacteria bacterium]|nr:flagellar M-ring protein FliF [Gammaproteobacteria bacterium]
MADSRGYTARAPGFSINMAGVFQHMGTLFGLAAALAIGVGIALWSLKPSYTPVFNSMSGRDATEMVDALRSSNIPYQIDEKSGLVLVPTDQAQQARMQLSSAGITEGSAEGLEILRKDSSLGTSQFIETARYQHALETELSRSISSMRNIEAARVHLAIPKQSVFVRNQSQTTASVLLKTKPGRSLEDGQILAIVNVVASGVPYLEASRVTIVDQFGRLLSSRTSDENMGLTRSQFDYSRQVESEYTQRIESLLTPIVGYGRVKAEVNAEIDFTTNEAMLETFTPANDKIRSEKVQETQSNNALGAAGVPGALSNTPPAGASLTPETAEDETKTTGNSSRSTMRNYELDKTIRRTRQAQGTLQRLSVAVVVDDHVVKSKKGGKEQRTPLTPEEIERINNLVKEAIGFREARGDSVVVLNSAFQSEEIVEKVVQEPIWKQAWVWSAIKQVAGAGVVLFILFGIVRPALRSYVNKTPAGAADVAGAKGTLAIAGNTQAALTRNQDPSQLPAPLHVYGDILNMARAMATDDPKRVAKVVKDWVGDDG